MKTQAERGPAILFENVKGYNIPVLVNVLSTRRRPALALGLPPDAKREEIDRTIAERMKREIEPKIVDTGPCKEAEENDVDLTKYPIPTMHEKNAGPYITGGFIVARHLETGVQNSILS